MKFTKMLEKRLAGNKSVNNVVRSRKAKIKANMDPQMESIYNYVKMRYIELGKEARERYISNYKKLAEKDKEVKLIMERLIEEMGINE